MDAHRAHEISCSSVMANVTSNGKRNSIGDLARVNIHVDETGVTLSHISKQHIDSVTNH